MKFWKIQASGDDLALYAAADTREGAIKKVESMTGPLDRSVKGFSALEIKRADIHEDEVIL